MKYLSPDDLRRMLNVWRRRNRRTMKRRHRPKKKSLRIKRSSDILTYCAARWGVKSRKGGTRRYRLLHFPKYFSFLADPNNSIRSLKRFVEYCSCRSTGGISVLQNECAYIGHDAESVANALAAEADRTLKMNFVGRFPPNQEIRDIALATGMHKYVGVDLPMPDGFETFELTHGGRGLMPDKNSIGTNLIEYVDRCLRRYHFALTNSEQAALGAVIGEVLGNAEEHSGRRDWWISGYLRQASDRNYGDCHITIFNFGDTLAESLQRLPPNARLRADIEEAVAYHSQKRFFTRDWTEESLWTLYALQEGVSRRNTDPVIVGHHGQGLPDMIEFFQTIGRIENDEALPSMFLLSGSTKISFLDRYKMKPMLMADGTTRRVLAFNDENNLDLPPSKEAVQKLEEFFPGTLVGMDFFFDPAYLKRISGSQ